MFNKEADIDWCVIEEFPQKINKISIDDPLTFEEYNKDVNCSLKWGQNNKNVFRFVNIDSNLWNNITCEAIENYGKNITRKWK